MKKSILLLSAAVLFAGCEKKMSPSECQSNYDRIIDMYRGQAQAAIASFASGVMSEAEMNNRIAQHAKYANAQAANLEDCCCWIKL